MSIKSFSSGLKKKFLFLPKVNFGFGELIKHAGTKLISTLTNIF